MTAAYVTVICDLVDGSGQQVTEGAISWSPSQEFPSAADDMLVTGGSLTREFRTGTVPQVKVLASDTAGPQQDGGTPGWMWDVTGDGVPGFTGFSVYVLSVNGDTQRLSALASVPAAQPGGVYLLVQGTPATDDVPVYQDDGTVAWEAQSGGSPGSGTVTSVSVEPANGFAGTVADSTSTPQITLQTTVDGVLKGDATTGIVSAAAAGTDYLAPGGSGAALTGITASQVGADPAGAAGAAQSAAQTYAAAQAAAAQSAAEAASFPLPSGSPAAGDTIAITGPSSARFYSAAWRFVIGPDAAAQYQATPDGGTTDNTAAFQSALNAATAWAQANSGRGKVFLEPVGDGYGWNGALQQGDLSTLGNNQVALPPCSPTAGKVILEFESDGVASPQYHWLQTATPQLSGAVIISNGLFGSSGAQSSSISTYGNPCMIGGPNQLAGGTAGTKYGESGLNFSNMCIVLKGLSFVVPRSDSALTFCPFDFSGLAQAIIRDCLFMQDATYASVWSNGGNISDLSGGESFAGLMPAAGNNDLNLIENVTVAGGFTFGIMLTEHTEIRRLSELYCWTPVCIAGSYFGSVGAGHVISGAPISVEGYDNLVKVFGSGTDGITQIDLGIDTEGTPTFIDDGGGGVASLCGRLRLGGLFPLSGVAIARTGLKIEASRTPSGWTFGYTGFSSAGSTVAVQNQLWRDARVYWSGGSITAVKAGGIGGVSAPSMTTVSTDASGEIDWPAGGWLSFTYTGSPAWNLHVS